MTAVWPPVLPKPNKDGFSLVPGEARLRRRADTGPGGMRRKSTAVPDLLTMAIDMTRSQWGVFKRFRKDTLKEGSLPFLMPDPITDGWPATTDDGVQLLDADGRPLLMTSILLCQFGEQMPTTTAIPSGFRVTLQLEILP